jgi:uridine kinase
MVQRKAIFRRQAYLIAVAGGTASGKTTVCHNIIEHLGDTNKRVVIISQDSFYRNLTAEDLTLAKAGNYTVIILKVLINNVNLQETIISTTQMPSMMDYLNKFCVISKMVYL